MTSQSQASGSQRTGGMTAIGILNIVFGSLGVLSNGLMVLLGGLLTATAPAMEQEFGSQMQGVGDLASTSGAAIMILGLVQIIASVMLGISGIGILKLAKWGGSFAIAAGSLIVILNGFSLFEYGVNVIGIIACSYAILLIGLCLSPGWKQAFAGQAAAGRSMQQQNGVMVQFDQQPQQQGAGAGNGTGAPPTRPLSASERAAA